MGRGRRPPGEASTGRGQPGVTGDWVERAPRECDSAHGLISGLRPPALG